MNPPPIDPNEDPELRQLRIKPERSVLGIIFRIIAWGIGVTVVGSVVLFGLLLFMCSRH